MNPGELLTKLTPEERMDMIMNGLRPGDISDVKKYKKGIGISLEEKIERAKTLVGETSNLGGATEREQKVEVDSQTNRVNFDEFESKITKTKPSKNNYKQLLKEEMNDYASIGKTIGSDDILSLKKVKNNSNINESIQSIELEGYTNAKNYLNAFVVNLQNEDNGQGYSLRINLFKALKKCLEVEAKYKERPQLLQAYRKGIFKAEKTLLNNLQS